MIALKEKQPARSERSADAVKNDLAELGVRDERVFQILVAALPEGLGFGATNLAQYGDPRALPILQSALAGLAVARAGELRNRDIIDVCDSITELGATLSPSEQRKLDQVRAELRAMNDDDDRAAAPRRNEACHCGSGRKYKRCHLRAQQQK